MYHTLSLYLYYIFPSKSTLCKHQPNQTGGLLAVLLEWLDHLHYAFKVSPVASRR